MSKLILPDDPDFRQPIVMGDPYTGLTPKTATIKRNKELDDMREKEGTTFKYANSAIAHAPDAWMKNAQATGVSNMMTQPMWFSPLHTPQNWQIASKRREVYQWSYISDKENPCYLLNYGDFSVVGIDDVYTKWSTDFALRQKMYIQNNLGEKAKPDICTKRHVHKMANKIKVLGAPHALSITHDHKCIVIKREDVKCIKRHKGTSKNCIKGVCAPTCVFHKCKRYQNIDYKISIVNAEDVKVGDYVLVPFPTEVKESVIKTIDDARFAGHLASDGSVSSTGLRVCMSTSEIEFVKPTIDAIFNNFGSETRLEYSSSGTAVAEIRTGKKSIHDFGYSLVTGKYENKKFTKKLCYCILIYKSM